MIKNVALWHLGGVLMPRTTSAVPGGDQNASWGQRRVGKPPLDCVGSPLHGAADGEVPIFELVVLGKLKVGTPAASDQPKSSMAR